MRFLLVLILALVVVWRWRSGHTGALAQRQPGKKPSTSVPPVEMVACLRCGLHLPAEDAVHGTRGPYCSALHREQAES